MRLILGFLAAISLVGCASQGMDGSGINRSSYSDYLAFQTSERLASVGGGASGGASSDNTASYNGAGEATGEFVGGSRTSSSGRISDEQDFAAVSSRETIESDAQRLEQFQSEYKLAKAVNLPVRPKGGTISVVQYALSTHNAVGETVYKRSFLASEKRAKRSCASYTSDDFAQQAFLESGGPKRDFKGLDPDGDGFACGWNPAPFRTAQSVAQDNSQSGDSSGVSKADLEALGITTGSNEQSNFTN